MSLEADRPVEALAEYEKSPRTILCGSIARAVERMK